MCGSRRSVPRYLPLRTIDARRQAQASNVDPPAGSRDASTKRMDHKTAQASLKQSCGVERSSASSARGTRTWSVGADSCKHLDVLRVLAGQLGADGPGGAVPAPSSPSRWRRTSRYDVAPARPRGSRQSEDPGCDACLSQPQSDTFQSLIGVGICRHRLAPANDRYRVNPLAGPMAIAFIVGSSEG
jgi:hypothetical protein